MPCAPPPAAASPCPTALALSARPAPRAPPRCGRHDARRPARRWRWVLVHALVLAHCAVASGAQPAASCTRAASANYAPFPSARIRRYDAKWALRCETEHRDWSPRAVAAYVGDGTARIDLAKAAKGAAAHYARMNATEAWLWTSLARAAAMPSDLNALTKSFGGPNDFVVLSSSARGAAFALNRMARAASADAVLLLLSNLQVSDLPEAAVHAAFDVLSANPGVGMVGIDQAAVYGTFGREAIGRRSRDVVSATYADAVGGLAAVVRRHTFLEVGALAERPCAVSGGACEPFLLVDLSVRMWRAGFPVVSVRLSGGSTAASSSSPPVPTPPAVCVLESVPATPERARAAQRPILLSSASFARPCAVPGGAYPPTPGHASATVCAEAVKVAQGCRLASPLAAPGCVPSDPTFSVIAQYFRRPKLLPKVMDSLAASADADEIWINDDSRSEVGEFAKAIGHRRNAYVVLSPNLHEIRGYNRMALLASGTYLAFVQDDDVAPKPKDWLEPAAKLFRTYNRTGLIGGFRGRMDFGTTFDAKHQQMHGIKYGVRFDDEKGKKKPERILHKDPGTNRKFMFLYKVSMGPMLARRGTFTRLGMFHTAYSCPGAPGIGFDFEFSIRNWKNGAQVGLYYSNFDFNAGDHESTGTRAPGAWARRVSQEKRNNAMLFDHYPGFHPKEGSKLAQDTLKAHLPKAADYRTWTDKRADDALEAKHGLKKARREAARSARRGSHRGGRRGGGRG